MRLSNHPTVKAYHEKTKSRPNAASTVDSSELKKMVLTAGADDAGLIEFTRETLAEFQQDLLHVMPDIQSIMVLVFRVNQDHLKSMAHSVANHEFKQVWTHANHVSRQIVLKCQAKGIKAVNMPVGFPYEATRWPGKMWLTCDKIFAIEAGMGHMGYHRLVIHPSFGAGIVMGTVLLGATCDRYDTPFDYNPCIECGLCLKVCPVGAVRKTDEFDFMACYSHNYRERLGGFQNWVEQMVDSKNHADYRSRVSDSETISMWQHLAIGAQTTCDRCMAICPAGEACIADYLDDRKAYRQKYLETFQNLSETIFVVKGSDAENHVRTKFPAKRPKIISNGIRPNSASSFLESLPLVFQPGQSEGLDCVYHFSFTGDENQEGTVTIKDKSIAVTEGLEGRSDLHVFADSQIWVRFLSKEISLPRALVTRKIKIKGSPRLMMAFAKCFPS